MLVLIAQVGTRLKAGDTPGDFIRRSPRIYRQRKSQAIYATDRMRTHLTIFFANHGDVALQPCSQAPSPVAILHFEKSCDKIAQPDWLTLLAIRVDECKQSRERAHWAIVSLAAVFSTVTQRSSGGALRDETKNGCEGGQLGDCWRI